MRGGRPDLAFKEERAHLRRERVRREELSSGRAPGGTQGG